MQAKILWQVTSGHGLCFGVVTDANGVILEAAPIAKWTVRQRLTISSLKHWLEHKTGYAIATMVAHE